MQSRGFGILDVGYRSQVTCYWFSKVASCNGGGDLMNRCCWCPVQDEAWAAGGSGVLLKTTNGGKSWVRDKAADNIPGNLYSVK